jgi:hypothetical protein
MTLPIFDTATTVIVEERWHGLLWSAFPARVITSTPDELVSYTPEGTIGTYATNRDLPQAEGLTREERKLISCAPPGCSRSSTPGRRRQVSDGSTG